MILRLSQLLTKWLRKRPESGMGYQNATIDGTPYLVLNATVALTIQQQNGPKYQLADDDIQWLLDNRKALDEALCLEDAQELNSALQQLGLEALNGTVVKVEPHGSYSATSGTGEVFVRYSAFRRDFRVDPKNGSVLPNTYVTTATDAPHVPSGLAAVGRYALPNPAPALYVFTLTPPAGSPIHCGTVAPKFGQAGGGVEVLFTAGFGLQGAVQGPVLIPER